jgi:hypothetical protein
MKKLLAIFLLLSIFNSYAKNISCSLPMEGLNHNGLRKSDNYTYLTLNIDEKQKTLMLTSMDTDNGMIYFFQTEMNKPFKYTEKGLLLEATYSYPNRNIPPDTLIFVIDKRSGSIRYTTTTVNEGFYLFGRCSFN